MAKAKATQNTVTATPIPVELATMVIQLSHVGQGIKAGREYEKAAGAKVGEWFASLAAKFRDAKVNPTKSDKVDIEGMDKAIAEAEAFIRGEANKANDAKRDAQGNVVLPWPAAWTQYKSNARHFVAQGLAKVYCADGKPIGIGKITEYLNDKRKADKAQGSPYFGTMLELRKCLEAATTFEKAVEGETQAAHKARQALIERAVVALGDAINASFLERGLNPPIIRKQADAAKPDIGTDAPVTAPAGKRKVRQAA